MESEFDLFGNEIIKDPILREKFIEPPFSVLDTKSGSWQTRKRIWQEIGIKSEVGRDAAVINMDSTSKKNNSTNYVSIFDPALCEVLYHWFCPEGGTILDPFAGSSTTGIASLKHNRNFIGIDLVEFNINFGRKRMNYFLETGEHFIPKGKLEENGIDVNYYKVKGKHINNP